MNLAEIFNGGSSKLKNVSLLGSSRYFLRLILKKKNCKSLESFMILISFWIVYRLHWRQSTLNPLMVMEFFSQKIHGWYLFDNSTLQLFLNWNSNFSFIEWVLGNAFYWSFVSFLVLFQISWNGDLHHNQPQTFLFPSIPNVDVLPLSIPNVNAEYPKCGCQHQPRTDARPSVFVLPVFFNHLGFAANQPVHPIGLPIPGW